MVEVRRRTPVNAHQNIDEGDGSWEDIPSDNLARSTPRSSVPPSLGRVVGARRRRAGSKTPVQAQQPQAARVRPHTPQAIPEEPLIDRTEVKRAVRHGTAFTVRYVGGILSTTVHLMRYPLALLLFVWLSATLITRMNHAFRTVFSPFCVIPGISSTPLCISPPVPLNLPWNGFDKLMEMQGSTFEHLLDKTAAGSVLSLDMKKTEMATKDMVTLLSVSKLKSKDTLAKILTDFSNEAKKSARGLQKFGAKVGGAVDSIMAYNDYAIRTISSANEKASSTLSRINPFSNNPSKEVVMQTFNDAMGVLAAQIERLVIEAELNIESLDRLEELLLTLHDAVSREDASISQEQSELLSLLWTKLGGFHRELRSNEQRLALLKEVSKYRTRALAHITGALQALQSISADMEELRERAAAPELLGASVPMEVHMASIQGGIERLKEGRMRAKEREADVVRSILGPDAALLD